MATDFWNREQIIFDSGPLKKAIHTNMALPGIFKPVIDGERVLVDGGAVNPVSYDLLPENCEFNIAVGVMGARFPKDRLALGMMGAVFNTYQFMQRSIFNEKMKQSPPDILVRPELEGFKVLDFWKTKEIFDQATSAKEKLKRELEIRIEKQ